MTAPVLEPQPCPSRDRIDRMLARLLTGPGAANARRLILAAVDDHAAAMIERYARPDDTWKPK